MIWDFIQNQILGMKWLNALIGNGLSVLGLDISSRLGGSIQFFLYDVIKITVLLCTLIFVISYIQSYFPPERSKKILGRFHGIWANIISALLGTVTPFCSCSSIPLFIGFTSAGLPLGVTFSFLISYPMVDLGSLVLLMSIFGAKVAIIYVVVGLVIAVVGGTLIEKLHMEQYEARKEGKWSHYSLNCDTLSEFKHFIEGLTCYCVGWVISNCSSSLQPHFSPSDSICTICSLLESPSALQINATSIVFIRSPRIDIYLCVIIHVR